jgi:hypothetical protein
LNAAGSGLLASGARPRRGASPSQSAATRRAPWKSARYACSGQHGQKIGKRREDRKTHAPAVAVLRAEQRHLPHDFGLRYVCRELTMHGLGDD